MQKINVEQLELNPFVSIGDDTFLLTSGNIESWNTMTAGWGGMGYIWGKPAVFVFVRESRYTLEFMNKYDDFTLSFFPPEEKDVLHICGTTSGRNTNKAEKASIRPISIDGGVSFEEANLVIKAKKVSCHFIDKDGILDEEIKSKWYKTGDWHYMFIGLIEGVYV